MMPRTQSLDQLELRIQNCIKADDLQGKGRIILSTPNDVRNEWDRFEAKYGIDHITKRQFFDSVTQFSKLDPYDAGRALHVLTLTLMNAHVNEVTLTIVDKVLGLADHLAKTVDWAQRPSYAYIQNAQIHATTHFSEPDKYIEMIKKAIDAAPRR